MISPLKVKVFHSENTALLEANMNQWLNENKTITIRHVKQSSTQYDTTVSVWYFEAQEHP